MKRALLVGVLLIALFAAFSFSAPHALAWGPCDGPYGGYAGCSMHTGYSGSYWDGYYGGYGYNRVCFWHWSWTWWGWKKYLSCTYVKVPPYPVSGVYGSYKMSGGGGYGGY